jgi:hypothetical protein
MRESTLLWIPAHKDHGALHACMTSLFSLPVSANRTKSSSVFARVAASLLAIKTVLVH